MGCAEQKEGRASEGHAHGSGFRALPPASLGLSGGDSHREPAWLGGVLGSLGGTGRSPVCCARRLGDLNPPLLLPPGAHPAALSVPCRRPCLAQPGG